MDRTRAPATSLTTRPRVRLTAEQLADVLALVKQAKTVELKLTVPETGYRSTALALGLDPMRAQLRQVVFFDTPDLALNARGVVVRARRSQGGPDDTVVKLRPVVPADLPEKLRKLPEFGVEVDALPGGYVCSASYKAKLEKERVRAVTLGERRISTLFSVGQRKFFDAHAPEGIALDGLTALGPLTVLKLKYAPKGFGWPLVVELWLYPDGSRILELSMKCRPADALRAAGEAEAFLGARGVDFTAEQATKTATALEFFANEIKETLP